MIQLHDKVLKKWTDLQAGKSFEDTDCQQTSLSDRPDIPVDVSYYTDDIHTSYPSNC